MQSPFSLSFSLPRSRSRSRSLSLSLSSSSSSSSPYLPSNTLALSSFQRLSLSYCPSFFLIPTHSKHEAKNKLRILQSTIVWWSIQDVLHIRTNSKKYIIYIHIFICIAKKHYCIIMWEYYYYLKLHSSSD